MEINLGKEQRSQTALLKRGPVSPLSSWQKAVLALFQLCFSCSLGCLLVGKTFYSCPLGNKWEETWVSFSKTVSPSSLSLSYVSWDNGKEKKPKGSGLSQDFIWGNGYNSASVALFKPYKKKICSVDRTKKKKGVT